MVNAGCPLFSRKCHKESYYILDFTYLSGERLQTYVLCQSASATYIIMYEIVAVSFFFFNVKNLTLDLHDVE